VDNAARAALEEFFRPESPGLRRAAERIRALDEGPSYDDATTAQLLHGFATIVQEALGGGGREARDLYNASAAELVRSQERTVSSVAGSFVIAGAILADELAQTASGEGRTEAVDWLAGFVSAWSRELLDAVSA
jgi:hypothetical protein